MTSPHLTSQLALHEQAVKVLRQIERIQKELAYAKRRAAADLNVWCLAPMVPGWKAQVLRLSMAYEQRCAQYEAITIKLTVFALAPLPASPRRTGNRLLLTADDRTN